jgi:hypothetical protein
MKPVLLNLKEEEGIDVFIYQIRNTIAGCRDKWKKMPKVRPFQQFHVF